jgi:hypothetical protein
VSYSTRDLISSYDHLVRRIMSDTRAEGYFVNFMFNCLPGRETTKYRIMQEQVTRFYDLLKRHTVRKPNAPLWRDLAPILIGAPDYPVLKKNKIEARLLRVNSGLHFNAVVLLPQMGQGGRRPRLQKCLIEHVSEKRFEYLTDRLYRIDVTPLKEGTTMVDYMLKALGRRQITGDEILLLKG